MKARSPEFLKFQASGKSQENLEPTDKREAPEEPSQENIRELMQC